MELIKFEIRVLLKHHYGNKIIKLLPWLEEYVKWKDNVSLLSMWHNDVSNVSTLEKKTLKIYHVLKDLNYEILRIYAMFWKKIRKKGAHGLSKEFCASKYTIHRQIKTLENHTEAVDLCLIK